MKVLYGIEYSCYSPLSEDESKYINEINGSILVYDENDVFLEIAGKFSFSFLNLELAQKENFMINYIFDWEDHLLAIGESMYDFENNTFAQSIINGIHEDQIGKNLLVFHFIEIAEKYRGKKLTTMALKDSINRFGHNCAFLAIRIFSVQHTQQKEFEEDISWLESLKLDKLEQDEEQAFYKLAAYFQSLGFININNNDIFALPLINNNPLDKFSLQIL